jgi:hypothetical protein
MGYGARPPDPAAIRPSVDVELDAWNNGLDGFDPPGPQHIAVMSNGDIVDHLFWAHPSFQLYGAAVHVWIVYDAGSHTMSVYASQSTSRPASPTVTATINLASIVGPGMAYVGFTGGTGQISAPEAILDWDLSQG